MTNHVLRTGQSATVQGDQWTNDNVILAGTAGSAAPTVTFVGANMLGAVSDIGTPAQPRSGCINLMPGGAITTNSLTIRNATLSINEHPGTSVTFDGTSTISNNSTLTATGYGGVSNYVLNGTMQIDGTSTVNMDYVHVSGPGNFHLTGEDALLRLGSVGAGTQVTLDGGVLSLTNGMSFLGTITDSAPATSQIGPIACIDLYNAMSAVSETFNLTTGVLQLFDANQNEVANLTFAGTGEMYAVPTSGLATNFLAITSHPASNALPVTITS